MANTRSKGKKISSSKNVKAENLTSSTRDQRPNKRPLAANTSGLAVFPDELLLEIMSYYPRPSDPLTGISSPSEYLQDDTHDHVAGHEALLALSQTCSNLRRFFRPYLWRRIEVRDGMQVGRHTLGGIGASANKLFNAELVRQLEIVTIRDPSLAQHVRLIRVDVKDYSIETVLAELARCMSLFSNLDVVTLRIFPLKRSRSNTVARLAEKAFSDYLYPQIHSLSVSKSAYSLLRSCPELRSVSRMDSYYEDPGFVKLMKQFCPKIDNLTFRIPAWDLGDILSAFPYLRTVTLRFPPAVFYSRMDQFGLFSRQAKQLQRIVISPTYPINEGNKEDVITWAVNLLRQLQKGDREEKEVGLYYLPEKTPATYSNQDLRRELLSLPVPKL